MRHLGRGKRRFATIAEWPFQKRALGPFVSHAVRAIEQCSCSDCVFDLPKLYALNRQNAVTLRSL